MDPLSFIIAMIVFLATLILAAAGHIGTITAAVIIIMELIFVFWISGGTDERA